MLLHDKLKLRLNFWRNHRKHELTLLLQTSKFLLMTRINIYTTSFILFSVDMCYIFIHLPKLYGPYCTDENFTTVITNIVRMKKCLQKA